MPKKKAGKKGAKIVDGVATNEMTREQLVGHVKRIQMELDREREERNFFMLEREKLYTLWNITLEELTSAKTEKELVTVKMDDNERERESEMHVYKQKLRYLMTEQSRNVAQVRLHNLQKMKHVQENMWSVQNSMRQTIDRKNREISKGQTSIYEMMRKLQLQNAENASKLKSEFCAEIRRMESTYERLMFQREKTQSMLEAAELDRTHTEKSEHIQQLMKIHEKQLSEMKDFFNEITVNNFAVISALQEETKEMRKKEEQLNKELARGRRDYKQLEETILKNKEELNVKLSQDRKSAQEIKIQLEKYAKRLKANERYSRMLEISNEALLQKAQLAQRERDQLKSSLTHAILDMQKKSAMKRLVLEMKLGGLGSNKNGKIIRKPYQTDQIIFSSSKNANLGMDPSEDEEDPGQTTPESSNNDNNDEGRHLTPEGEPNLDDPNAPNQADQSADANL